MIVMIFFYVFYFGIWVKGSLFMLDMLFLWQTERVRELMEICNDLKLLYVIFFYIVLDKVSNMIKTMMQEL